MITAKADSRKRVLIPNARPGQVFEIVPEGEGNYRILLVKSAKRKASVLDDLKPLTKEETKRAFAANDEFDALEHHCARLPVRPPSE